MSDTAEDFIPLPGSDNVALDAMFIAPPKTFRGKKLFPYSEGVRLLLNDVAGGIQGDDRYFMLLVFLLLDLQDGFDAQKKARPAISDDDATDSAVEGILELIGNKPKAYQAKTLRRAGKLGKEGVAEAVKLALEIYKEAQGSELVSAEEETASGK